MEYVNVKHPAELLRNGAIRRDGKTVVRIVYADDEMAAAIVAAVEAEMRRREGRPSELEVSRAVVAAARKDAEARGILDIAFGRVTPTECALSGALLDYDDALSPATPAPAEGE